MNNIELKKIRNELGLTQLQLAQKLHKTKDCITKWESGKYPIPKSMQKLIEAIQNEMA